MKGGTPILPIHGEVAPQSADGGGGPQAPRLPGTPSVSRWRGCHLPMNGED